MAECHVESMCQLLLTLIVVVVSGLRAHAGVLCIRHLVFTL